MDKVSEPISIVKTAQPGVAVLQKPEAYRLIRRIRREFQIRQPHTLQHNLVGANRRRSFEACRSARSHEVILVDAVAADAEPSHERSIAIQRHGSREKYNSALIRSGNLKSLRAGIRYILQIEIEKWARGAAVNSGRKKGLGAVAN